MYCKFCQAKKYTEYEKRRSHSPSLDGRFRKKVSHASVNIVNSFTLTAYTAWNIIAFVCVFMSLSFPATKNDLREEVYDTNTVSHTLSSLLFSHTKPYILALFSLPPCSLIAWHQLSSFLFLTHSPHRPSSRNLSPSLNFLLIFILFRSGCEDRVLGKMSKMIIISILSLVVLLRIPDEFSFPIILVMWFLSEETPLFPSSLSRDCGWFSFPSLLSFFLVTRLQTLAHHISSSFFVSLSLAFFCYHFLLFFVVCLSHFPSALV